MVESASKHGVGIGGTHTSVTTSNRYGKLIVSFLFTVFFSATTNLYFVVCSNLNVKYEIIGGSKEQIIKLLYYPLPCMGITNPQIVTIYLTSYTSLEDENLGIKPSTVTSQVHRTEMRISNAPVHPSREPAGARARRAPCC
jgi:hypothetical protein